MSNLCLFDCHILESFFNLSLKVFFYESFPPALVSIRNLAPGQGTLNTEILQLEPFHLSDFDCPRSS